MCQYADAARACDAAARRAEYTARQSSKLAVRIDDPKSQTHREAEALVDEWVAVKDGLSTAADILTLISQHPAAFEAFQAALPRQGLSPARAQPGAAQRVIQAQPAVAALLAARSF